MIGSPMVPPRPNGSGQRLENPFPATSESERRIFGMRLRLSLFRRGPSWLRKGERNPGLYYVIDGFLDVGIPVNDRGEDKLLGRSVTGSQRVICYHPLRRSTTNSSRASGTADLTAEAVASIPLPDQAWSYAGLCWVCCFIPFVHRRPWLRRMSMLDSSLV